MPVSHIGLTVSHLPTSCSFFLSALQPLGYRFIGQQGNQIGLGIKDEADFFICQETPGVKAGAAHIAFTAPSRVAVRDFYTAALNAGGRPNGAPANRTEDDDHFNAAVLDFDGNSIEVVHRKGPDVRDDGTVVEHSRVITWQRSVAGSIRDDRSVVSSRTTQSASKQALLPAPASSKAPSVVSAASTLSKAAGMVRSVSAPVVAPAPSAAPQVTAEVTTTTKVAASGDGAAKKIIGTLLGAAAGAAVAYAMVKSEEDSAKKETKFANMMEAKEMAMQAKAQIAQLAAANEQLALQAPQPVYESAAGSVRGDDQRSVYSQRMIEPAPQSYHSPSYTSVPPTQVGGLRQIEYVPAYSVAPSRTQFSSRRSVTSPELSTVSKARSTASTAKAPSVAPSAVHSTAPSTLISSFVPDHVERRASEGSVHSHHTSTSRAKSHVSKHSSASKSRSRAPSPPPSQPKAASIVGSILGRGGDSGSVVSSSSKRSSKSKKSSREEEDDEFEIEDMEFLDADSVAPSDSISNAGSHRSHRSHRSHKSHRSSHSKHHDSDSKSSVSKHSSSSKHSKSSKHSHHSSSSKRSHRSRHTDREPSPLSNEWHDVQEHVSVVRPSVVSEPSDASTVKPAKSRAGSRKDSVTGDIVQESSVVNLPVRGITPSMINGESSGNGGRSMMSYAMGQRLRAFE